MFWNLVFEYFLGHSFDTVLVFLERTVLVYSVLVFQTFSGVAVGLEYCSYTVPSDYHYFSTYCNC